MPRSRHCAGFRLLCGLVLCLPALAQTDEVLTISPSLNTQMAGYDSAVKYSLAFTPPPASASDIRFQLHYDPPLAISYSFSTVKLAGGEARSTLSLFVHSTTPVGTYQLRPEVVSNLTNASLADTTLTLKVDNFTVSASPAEITIPRGEARDVIITFTPQSSFSRTFTPILTGLPKNTVPTFSPATVTCSYGNPERTILRINVSSKARKGTYPLSIIPYGYFQRAYFTLVIQ